MTEETGFPPEPDLPLPHRIPGKALASAQGTGDERGAEVVIVPVTPAQAPGAHSGAYAEGWRAACLALAAAFEGLAKGARQPHAARAYQNSADLARDHSAEAAPHGSGRPPAITGEPAANTGDPQGGSGPQKTPETTHACPPEDGGVMPCCLQTPFEVPPWHRMTLDPALVTCPGKRDLPQEPTS